MNAVYLKGELVWAKVTGFPWWPGVIKSIHLKRKQVSINKKIITTYEDEPKAFIRFVGDHSHIIAPLSKIDKFCIKYHDHSQSKNKQVQKAIELAKQLLAQSKVQVPATILYDFLGKKRLKTISQSKQEKECKKLSSNGKNKKMKLIENHIKNKRRKKEMSHKSITNTKDEAEDGIEGKVLNGKRRNKKIVQDDDDSDTYSEYSFSSLSEERLISSNENCEEIKDIIEHLLKIKIEKRTKESQKYIVEALQDLTSIMNTNSYSDTYILTKDLVPVLTAYTLSNNEDIVTYCIQLLSLISNRVISESFNMRPNEFSSLKKKHYQITYQISQMSPQHKKSFIAKISSHLIEKNHSTNGNIKGNGIYPNNSSNSPQPKPKSKPNPKRKKPLKLIEDEEEEDKEQQDENSRHNQSEDNCNGTGTGTGTNINVNVNGNSKVIIDSTANEETFINFLLKKIITEDQIIQKENIDKGIISPTYFYTNVYNKNNQSNDQYTYLRKSVCLKLFNIIKVLMPESKEENLKKSVLFLEYIARIRDPDFGEQYKEIIDKFYIRIKELTKYPSANQIKFNKVIYIMLNKYSFHIDKI